MKKTRKQIIFSSSNPFKTRRKIKNSRDMAKAYLEESMDLRKGLYFTRAGGNRSKLSSKFILEEVKVQLGVTTLSFRQ